MYNTNTCIILVYNTNYYKDIKICDIIKVFENWIIDFTIIFGKIYVKLLL